MDFETLMRGSRQQEDNTPAITPEKVSHIIHGIDDGDVYYQKTYKAVCQEYLKLHEENTRLSNMLKAAEITEQDNMQLREENTRLQAFLKTIADL